MVSNLLYSPDHPWAPDPPAPAFQVLWLTTAVCHHAQQHCVSWYSMSKRHKAKLSKDTRIVQKGTYFPNQGNESETTKKTVQGKQCSLKKKKTNPLKKIKVKSWERSGIEVSRASITAGETAQWSWCLHEAWWPELNLKLTPQLSSDLHRHTSTHTCTLTHSWTHRSICTHTYLKQ